MGSIFQSLLSLVKEGRDALLAPAEDPRDRYGTNYSNPDGPKGRKATLEERREYLETGFSAMNSETGSMALEELAHEYAQLQPVLQRRKETDPLAVVHLPGLVEEAYQQGLSILEDAMELGRAVTLRDRDKLECDVVRLQGESSGPHHQDSGEAKIRESTAGVSRKPSSDCKACGCSSKHLCGLTAWNT